MKKLLPFLVFIVFLAASFVYASAQEKKYKKLPGGFRINVGSLRQYEPFVWEEIEMGFANIRKYYVGFYPELSNVFFDDIGIPKDFVHFRTYDDLASLGKAAKDGFVDYIIGLHFTEEEFLNYELLYPPIYQNPITAFLRLDKINTVTKWSDLDEMQGVARSDEFFSEMYNKDIRNNPKIKMVENSYEAFDLLLKEEVDYFLTSAYSGQAEAFKMGIMDLVTFVRQPKWRDNIFLGASIHSKKTKEYNKEVIEMLTEYRNAKKADSLMFKTMEIWQDKHIDARLKKFSDFDPKLIVETPEEDLEFVY